MFRQTFLQTIQVEDTEQFGGFVEVAESTPITPAKPVDSSPVVQQGSELNTGFGTPVEVVPSRSATPAPGTSEDTDANTGFGDDAGGACFRSL